jgi:putative FmdB family regulatory protein
MPTYEYECKACGHTFEEWQSITADPIKKCPQCGKKKVERLFGTGGAIIFKGSGFYITDYRSDGYKKAAKAESDSSSSAGKSDSDSGGKSESASAGGAATKKDSDTPKVKPADSKPRKDKK